MLRRIQEELSLCERAHGVRILLAVESGSRCWGFESPDSDWDVRFVYARPISDYLRLERGRDTVEWLLEDDLDVVGWDLAKFLRLVRRSNPTAFEWLGSPIAYREDSAFGRVRELAGRCFDPVSAAHHYLGMAKKHDERYIRANLRTPKRYLYAVRSILACEWCIERKMPVPMLFSELQEAMLGPEMREIVSKLVEIKRSGLEKASCDPIPALDEWVLGKTGSLRPKIDALERPEAVSWAEMDETFLKAIGFCR